jgi:hypothetical protein
VERLSRYVCLVWVTGKETQTVVRALTRYVKRTLTWDRGLELAAHRAFSIATGVQVFFCDPKSPWQRGTNENTDGLLGQYLPREDRPVRSHVGSALCDCPAAEHPTAQDTWLSDVGGYTCGHCFPNAQKLTESVLEQVLLPASQT